MRNPFRRPKSFHVSLTATIVPEASRITALAGSDFNPSNVATARFMIERCAFDETSYTTLDSKIRNI